MQDPNSRLNSYDDPGYHEYMKSPNLEQFANDSKPRPVDVVVGIFPKPTPDVKLETLKERCERVTLVPTGNEGDDFPY